MWSIGGKGTKEEEEGKEEEKEERLQAAFL